MIEWIKWCIIPHKYLQPCKSLCHLCHYKCWLHSGELFSIWCNEAAIKLWRLGIEYFTQNKHDIAVVKCCNLQNKNMCVPLHNMDIFLDIFFFPKFWSQEKSEFKGLMLCFCVGLFFFIVLPFVQSRFLDAQCLPAPCQKIYFEQSLCRHSWKVYSQHNATHCIPKHNRRAWIQY